MTKGNPDREQSFSLRRWSTRRGSRNRKKEVRHRARQHHRRNQAQRGSQKHNAGSQKDLLAEWEKVDADPKQAYVFFSNGCFCCPGIMQTIMASFSKTNAVDGIEMKSLRPDNQQEEKIP